MSTISKERVKDILEFGAGRIISPITDDEIMELARIALASLEAEAVGEVVLGEYDDCGCHPDARVVCIAADGQADWDNFKDGTRLYTTPPAPVSVPDELTREEYKRRFMEDDDFDDTFRGGWNACRAAMLQGAENVESRCGIQTAPALDSSPKNAESRCGKSPVITDGWVDCSERMPNDKDYVWCWGRVVGWTEDDGFEAYYDATRNKWWAVTMDGEEPVRKVTHWQPLPSPPAK